MMVLNIHVLEKSIEQVVVWFEKNGSSPTRRLMEGNAFVCKIDATMNRRFL